MTNGVELPAGRPPATFIARQAFRLALGLALALATAANAQLGEFNQAGVRYGHIHMLVRDVEAHERS